MKNGPYELVKVPATYPGRRYRNGLWAYEHVLVWWQNTDELPPPGFVVHHKNEQKRDNRFENLELKTRAEHTAEHNVRTPVLLTCSYCGKQIERQAGEVRWRSKSGQKDFYCSTSHQALHRHRKHEAIVGFRSTF